MLKGRDEQPVQVLYEDNHLVAVNKPAGELVQGDKGGDIPLPEFVKQYLKLKYKKPGEVFLGVIHRIDRPVSGVLLYARTSKALERMNKLFQEREVKKVYWAVISKKPPSEEGVLEHFMRKNQEKNLSKAFNKEVHGSKIAKLRYKLLAEIEGRYLLEVRPETGRHHQIRAQLAAIGCPIKGDAKYGSRDSNDDRSIHLHARLISFVHPVKKEVVSITAPVPHERLWKQFQLSAV